MKYRKLAANGGDYSFGRNADDFVSGELAVAQAVKTSLLLLQGEWWEDTSQGVPLFQSILSQTGKIENRRAADTIIQSTILSVPGVLRISNYKGTFNSQTRTYAIACNVTTQYGDAPISVTY